MLKLKSRIGLEKRLYQKIRREARKWMSELRKKSKEEIINNAHNIVLFKEIVDLIQEYPDFLTKESMTALLSLDNTLLEIQDTWYQWDKDICSEMECAIKYLAEKVSEDTSLQNAA